jgi:hypothetical protein
VQNLFQRDNKNVELEGFDLEQMLKKHPKTKKDADVQSGRFPSIITF